MIRMIFHSPDPPTRLTKGGSHDCSSLFFASICSSMNQATTTRIPIYNSLVVIRGVSCLLLLRLLTESPYLLPPHPKGFYSEAAKLYLKVQRMRTKVLGEDHLSVAEVLNGRGLVLVALVRVLVVAYLFFILL